MPNPYLEFLDYLNSVCFTVALFKSGKQVCFCMLEYDVLPSLIGNRKWRESLENVQLSLSVAVFLHFIHNVLIVLYIYKIPSHHSKEKVISPVSHYQREMAILQHPQSSCPERIPVQSETQNNFKAFHLRFRNAAGSPVITLALQR